MTDELFPLDSISMDSPRLRWIKQHGVKTAYDPDVDYVWSAWIGAEESDPKCIRGTGHTAAAALGDLVEGCASDEVGPDLEPDDDRAFADLRQPAGLENPREQTTERVSQLLVARVGDLLDVLEN
jgi:hypothetical protein